MKGEGIVPIRSVPGVKRDGTEFEGANYIDAQWCRFRRGLPRKIGGYRSISSNLQGPVHSTYIHSSNGSNRLFFGSSSALEYTDVTPDGIGGGIASLTPATLVADNNNLWQFDEMYDGGGNISVLMAHAAPNLSAIDSTEQRNVWFGDIDGSTALTNTTAAAVSGGVFCAAPYAFTLDNDGWIAWPVANTPNDWVGAGSGEARITKSKLIYGARVRGANALTFLVWSLDTLVRGVFTGGAAVFSFNELGTISLMSSRSVVEYNGIYYWMGQDRFQYFTGVIQDLPNEFNLDLLFGNDSPTPINMNQRQKVWGVAVPKYGEIHWHVPLGDSDECNHVVVYNIAGNFWFDYALARTAGINSSVFRWPVLIDKRTSDLTMVRVLNGTAASSAGVAANAFDGDLTTICSAGVNGNISYDFGQFVTKHIHHIGIVPGAGMTSPSALEIEYSVDTGVAPSNWSSLISIPSQAWVAGTLYEFTLAAGHVDDLRAVRARIAGGNTLTLAELYIEGHGHIAHQHEFGFDAIVDGNTFAIPSWFETADISFMATGPVAASEQWVGKNVNMETAIFEPDFVQVGDMSVIINARPYPKSSPPISSDTKTFGPATEKTEFKYQGRILRMKFVSNTQGGFYQMGQPVITVAEGDVHR
jgi:hypothetical protein